MIFFGCFCYYITCFHDFIGKRKVKHSKVYFRFIVIVFSRFGFRFVWDYCYLCGRTRLVGGDGRFMITKRNISDFFEEEADAARTKWEALMRLPVGERIRKRKAIRDVFVDGEDLGRSAENDLLVRLNVRVNVSDFKEGECLLLHEEGSSFGVRCTLNGFEGENSIIVGVYPMNMPDKQRWMGIPLVLDVCYVDLRSSVYFPFLESLPDYDLFWKSLLVNDVHAPEFGDVDRCRKELDGTVAKMNLSLTERQYEAVLRCMACKDYYLVQGPPGTGKSFVLGLVILEELMFFHHKVIVVGPNHLAINNALGQVLKLIPGLDVIVKVGQSYNAATQVVEYEGRTCRINNRQRVNAEAVKEYAGELLLGMTPHSMYTNRARGIECDTLIVDEAGQMTLPLALMGMVKAKKVILAGDHKQLPPIISSDSIDEDMRVSVFQKLINKDNCTMLDVSFRMCEPICEFVSSLFYDGGVRALRKGNDTGLICDDGLLSFDRPVVMKNIDDDGEQASDGEAEFVAETVGKFLKCGLSPESLAVVTPFRAQAANIRRTLARVLDIDEEERKKITVDTVDKMQGQERDVIFYSFTSGNVDYMKEMGEFLYNPNKLNVAFSRAKSKLIIVGNLERIGEVCEDCYPHISQLLQATHIYI